MKSHFIKICGITSYEDAVRCIDAGATAIGFNFYSGSKRYIEPKLAKEIAEKIRGKISLVGVFVNAEISSVKEIASFVKLTYCQFHGDETPNYVSKFGNAIKSFRVNDSLRNISFEDYKAFSFLLDAYDEKEFGGTGKNFNWILAREANEFGKIILAGGLTPENVQEAIQIAQPWGVDVSSGVEVSAGKKDKNKIRAFVENAQKIFQENL